MIERVGRNDPCPCGSGKKYKNCCFSKDNVQKPKYSAKWINKLSSISPLTPPTHSPNPVLDKPQQPLEQQRLEQPRPQDKPVDLMERAFGAAIALGKMTERPLFVKPPKTEKP